MNRPSAAPALTLALAATAATAPACTEPVADGPPYTAEVVALTGWDADEEHGIYELAPRELGHLDDLEDLRGPWFSLRRGGELVIVDGAGSVVNDGRFSDGGAPALRYTVDDDVVRARDYPTLAMLSSWYQFEQVFAAIERVTGTPADALVADTGPFEIFFEPSIRQEGDVDVTASLKFNAFYLTGKHQFGLARRSPAETVPLAANQMVIAHEFGHALFEQTFFSGEAPACDEDAPDLDGRLTVEYAISGLNEGFSDFVSFAMTASTNPLGDVDFLGDERSLTRRAFTFDDLADEDGDACDGAFYCVGTLFARALHDAYLATGGDPTDPEARGAFAREAVAAMSSARATLAAADSMPAPSATVLACERAEELDHAYDGAVTGAFLAAFAAGLDASRPAFCAAAVDQFGEVGFPPALRAPCEVAP